MEERGEHSTKHGGKISGNLKKEKRGGGGTEKRERSSWGCFGAWCVADDRLK